MEEKSQNGLEKIIFYVKNHFWNWFIYIITTSLVLLVSFSLIFKESITLSTINNWVGVILGLVALVATVFSLGLSFYNFDKQNELDKKNRDLMNQVLNETKRTNEKLASFENGPHALITTTSQQSNSSKANDLRGLSEALNSKITSEDDRND